MYSLDQTHTIDVEKNYSRLSSSLAPSQLEKYPYLSYTVQSTAFPLSIMSLGVLGGRVSLHL